MTATLIKECSVPLSLSLCERLCNNINIKLCTKCKVYFAVIVSCLMDSPDMVTLYKRYIQRLTHDNQRLIIRLSN